jgi:hypothetical protein
MVTSTATILVLALSTSALAGEASADSSVQVVWAGLSDRAVAEAVKVAPIKLESGQLEIRATMLHRFDGPRQVEYRAVFFAADGRELDAGHWSTALLGGDTPVTFSVRSLSVEAERAVLYMRSQGGNVGDSPLFDVTVGAVLGVALGGSESRSDPGAMVTAHAAGWMTPTLGVGPRVAAWFPEDGAATMLVDLDASYRVANRISIGGGVGRVFGEGQTSEWTVGGHAVFDLVNSGLVLPWGVRVDRLPDGWILGFEMAIGGRAYR